MAKDVILVTGASSDMGAEIIREISGKENIVIAHFNKSGEIVQKLKDEMDSEIIPVKADLTVEKEISGFIGFIREKYGSPDKIVHLPAPKIRNIRFKDVLWRDFEDDINLQLKSIVLILKEFLPVMAKKKRGKVIFMLSSCTFNVPPRFFSNYVTVKYAVLGLMKSLAADYAGKGININAVSPSMTETKFLDNIDRKIVKLNADSNPTNRNACVKDIAPLVKFLLSKESDYLTGINISVTGGSIF